MAWRWLADQFEFIVVMFSGLLFLRNASHAVGLTLLIGGAIATFTAFYSWLTAPLE